MTETRPGGHEDQKEEEIEEGILGKKKKKTFEIEFEDDKIDNIVMMMMIFNYFFL